MSDSHTPFSTGDFVPSGTHPLGEARGSSGADNAWAVLALSHTPMEDRLYCAMLKETAARGVSTGAFSIRRLMLLTGHTSYSTIRRARSGLLQKLSIEGLEDRDGGTSREGYFRIFLPAEIFARRQSAGLKPYPKEVEAYQKHSARSDVLERLAGQFRLSRREAQVALICAEGKTNAEIGERLGVGTETVKFHLRNIFTKFGVRRRTELISRLLMRET
jgi:DNA-binding CsgD family transcriptional regulator